MLNDTEGIQSANVEYGKFCRTIDPISSTNKCQIRKIGGRGTVVDL